MTCRYSRHVSGLGAGVAVPRTRNQKDVYHLRGSELATQVYVFSAFHYVQRSRTEVQEVSRGGKKTEKRKTVKRTKKYKTGEREK